jgi:hypothetical protein
MFFFFFLSCCLIRRQFFAIGRQLWEELEDKFFQLELQFLVVSSCVIPRQICPILIGIVICVSLCNTKTNILWCDWKKMFLFQHGEPMELRYIFLKKRKTN